MNILALDPAEYKIGWAIGNSGSLPATGLLKLREKDERTEEAIGRFAQWLQSMLKNEVNLLAVEHFLPSGALEGKTSDATREGAIGLAYAARAVAAIQRVPYRSPYPNQIRKHFIQRASMGDSASTKRAVCIRAQQLGYVEKGFFEDNVCDAVALWDFAASHFARKASPEFVLT